MASYTFNRPRGIRPNQRGEVRNAHLFPDIAPRVQTFLERASFEEEQAFRVNPTLVSLYKRLNRGRRCSCLDLFDENPVETNTPEPVSLEQFLLRVPKLLPTVESCPICFDTGWVGGYERVGCFTVTLDSTFRHNKSKVKLVNTRPSWFLSTTSTGQVAWFVDIPNYFLGAEVYIRWNQRPTTWSLSLNGQPISFELLDSLKGVRACEFALSMRDGRDQNAGFFAVTLVFIVSSEHFLPTDFPNLTRTLTADMNIIHDISSPFTVHFDRKARIHTTDLFVDQRWKRCWRIIESLDVDPKNINIHHETQARLVRDFESRYFVPNRHVISTYHVDSYDIIVWDG